MGFNIHSSGMWYCYYVSLYPLIPFYSCFSIGLGDNSYHKIENSWFSTGFAPYTICCIDIYVV